MTTPDKQYLNSWIDINTQGLETNIQQLASVAAVKNQESLLMVKGNAYGHGLLEVGRLAGRLGIAGLGIVSLSEAQQLREDGVSLPLLLFTESPVATMPLLAELAVTPVISSYDFLKQLLATRPEIPFHLKVNCGLNRYGINLEDMPSVIKLMNKYGSQPEGLATHYSSATVNQARTQKEFEVFCQAKQLLQQAGFAPRFIHASNSAATMWFEETETNLVRLGLAAYGMQPNDERPLDLQPTFTWLSRLTAIRNIRNGEGIGYAQSWTASRETVLGIIATGYSDGLRRGPRHQSHLLWQDTKLPLIGTVMMNHAFVDLTDAPDIQLGDELTVTATQSKAGVSPEAIGRQVGTSNEEILTSVSPLIPRFFSK